MTPVAETSVQRSLFGAAPAVCDDDERAATCALAGLGGVGAVAVALLRARYGRLADAVKRPPSELAAVPGLRADAATALAAARDLPGRGRWLLAKAHEIKASVLVAGEAAYPRQLADAGSPPPVLYLLGTWREEARRVAVVGSRRSDAYGLEATRKLVRRLVASGVEVVSGGAEGVDAAAHVATIEAGGRTVGVVGTGLLSAYPASHAELYRRIAEHGALVSEFALDAGGQKSHFPQRNRTLAGVSEVVVITRGRENSGAVITCTAARDLGRPIFAVPGDVSLPESHAPNTLLASGGALAALDGAEVVKALGLPVGPEAPAPVRALPPTLSDGARRVYGALGPAARHVDELAADLAVPTSALLAGLLELELAGLCAARPGKYFSRR